MKIWFDNKATITQPIMIKLFNKKIYNDGLMKEYAKAGGAGATKTAYAKYVEALNTQRKYVFV
jgi:hypothetical protein